MDGASGPVSVSPFCQTHTLLLSLSLLHTHILSSLLPNSPTAFLSPPSLLASHPLLMPFFVPLLISSHSLSHWLHILSHSSSVFCPLLVICLFSFPLFTSPISCSLLFLCLGARPTEEGQGASDHGSVNHN